MDKHKARNVQEKRLDNLALNVVDKKKMSESIDVYSLRFCEVVRTRMGSRFKTRTFTFTF